MNKFLQLTLLMSIFMGSLSVTAQKTWVGANNGNWNTAGNWSPSGVPGSGDQVTINSSVNINVDASPTISGLIVSNNATVSFTSSGGNNNAARTMTINNSGSNINAGSSLELRGGANNRRFTLAFSGTNRTFAINGSLIISSVGAGSTFTVTNSLTTVNGTLTNSGGTITSTAANLTIAADGTYNHSVNGGAIPIATWNSNSTFLVTGITTATSFTAGVNQSYGNLTWNNTGQTSAFIFGGPTTINGTLFIQSTGASPSINSSLLLTNSASLTSTILGNLSITGGYFAPFGAGTTGNCVLNISGDLSLATGTFDVFRQASNTANINLSGDFSMSSGTLTKNNAGTANFNFAKSGTQAYLKSEGTISNAINFIVNSSSILDVGNSVIDGSTGTFTLSSGSGLITANTNGITSSGAVGSIQVSGARTFSTGANYTYNGSSVQVTGNGLPQTVNNITFSNPSGVTLNASTTVNGDLTLNNAGLLNLGSNTLNRANSGGILTLGSGTTIQLGGTNSFPTNYVAHSIEASSTIQYNGSNQSVALLNSNQSYGNLTLSGSGTKTFADATDTAIRGHLIVDAETTVIAPTRLNFNGITAQNIGGLAYNSIEFSGAGAKTFTSNASVSPTGAITFGTGGATVDFDGDSNNLIFQLKSDDSD